jgi:hypothetical protein
VGDRGRTVWVLGAGFSKSLGGPLLPDLFSKTSYDLAKLRFPESKFPKLHAMPVRVAHWLYHYGRKFADGHTLESDRSVGDSLWGHAEEFLDRLDAAALAGSDGPNWKHLQEPLTRAPGRLKEDTDAHNLVTVAAAARRLLAAECSGFLLHSNMDEERWQPYVRWARQLSAEDVVISFNYDRVLETLMQDPKIPLMVLMPNGEKREGTAPLLKLHGSVDWSRKPNADETAAVYEPDQPLFALGCHDSQISIASPGPSKLARARELRPLWIEAKKALEVAESVVFVGYRFPPSDSEARSKLLEAVGSNSSYKAVHTVLGPASPQDTARLGQLLHWTLRRTRRELTQRVDVRSPSARGIYNLVQHHLYAEDFFSVFTADMIERPHKWLPKGRG